MIYIGKNGRKYQTSEKHLGKGGEGVVYPIENASGSVAKIYPPEKKSPEDMKMLHRKLQVMLGMKFDPYQSEGGIRSLTATWPEDILYDSQGRFAGYVMPALPQGAKSLVVACRTAERDCMLFKNYSWNDSIRTAYNLAKKVAYLHHNNIVIGDMNSKNIQVTPDAGITFIDTDSFDIASPDGTRFKCTVGMPEVWPAEIQGKDMRKGGNTFTVYTDRFALAVHIFLLLCNNFHPFNVAPPNGKASVSTSVQSMNIVRGNCPRDRGEAGPVGAPSMELLPDYIMALFKRAFGYTASNAVQRETIAHRPTADEWADALKKLLDEPKATCRKNAEHTYLKKLHSCPWCSQEKVIAASNRKNSPAPVSSTKPAYVPMRPATASGPAVAAKQVYMPAKSQSSHHSLLPLGLFLYIMLPTVAAGLLTMLLNQAFRITIPYWATLPGAVVAGGFMLYRVIGSYSRNSFFSRSFLVLPATILAAVAIMVGYVVVTEIVLPIINFLINAVNFLHDMTQNPFR